MNLYSRTILGGFMATLVLSALMVMKSAMGIMPDLNVIHMLGNMAGKMMGQGGPVIGWILHFVIGTLVWGIAFALFNSVLPGTGQVAKGISFGVVAWLLMMVGPMPMAGAGLFGLKMGIMAPVMTLVLHIIWGAVLGFVVATLPDRATAA